MAIREKKEGCSNFRRKFIIFAQTKNGYGIHQRISQAMDRNNAAINRILEEAAYLVGREKETTGNIEPADGHKKKQINLLKDYNSSFVEMP